MALFLKQTEQRTQLQEKIASDLMSRTQASGDGGIQAPKPGDAMLEESQEATGRSVFLGECGDDGGDRLSCLCFVHL